MKRFTDLPDSIRMDLRRAIENTGAADIDYLSDGRIQVALPAEKPMAAVYAIESLGFRENGGYYFPLGTDRTPETLRHFGPGTPAAPRGDRPSYWLRWTFELKVNPGMDVVVSIQELEAK